MYTMYTLFRMFVCGKCECAGNGYPECLADFVDQIPEIRSGCVWRSNTYYAIMLEQVIGLLWKENIALFSQPYLLLPYTRENCLHREDRQSPCLRRCSGICLLKNPT